VINQGIDEFARYVFLNDDKAYEIAAETYNYIAKQAYVVDFPTAYTYTLWWPWLKNYHGEYVLGTSNNFGFTKYIWIDQDLKRSMGY
ncbi:MAG: hypothetical protein U1B77_01825, partial [Dehalococcoidales bacterium]|nr:hypothetical protein [Dehalococcoidales bacterium]